MQRKSGIVFVCVRDADFEGTKRQECAFAVRRALPGRAGHTPTFKVFVSDWKPAGEAMLDIGDPAVDSIDALWESLCSQVTLGSASPTALDARMTRRMQAAQLTEQIDKPSRAISQRANESRTAQRNLHQAAQGEEPVGGTEEAGSLGTARNQGSCGQTGRASAE